MTEASRLYDFVFPAHLAEEALDRVGRVHQKPGLSDEEIAAKVSLAALDERFVEQAQRMATV